MITEDVEKFFQQFKWKRIQRDWKRASVVMDSKSTALPRTFAILLSILCFGKAQ